jgi:hypothetical protein
MPLPSSQLVRQRIQDEPLYANATYHGDGTANEFTLPHRNLSSGSAFVPLGGAAWTPTAATFNPSGTVTFSNVISANSAFNVRYVHSIFSDEVISSYLSAQGSIDGAALQCAYDLQFDAIKRAKWAAPDGSMLDDSQARETIREIIAAIQGKMREEAISEGSIQAWSENQADY